MAEGKITNPFLKTNLRITLIFPTRTQVIAVSLCTQAAWQRRTDKYLATRFFMVSKANMKVLR